MEQLTKSIILLIFSLFSMPLKATSNIASNDWTPLHQAAFSNELEDLERLIEEKKVDLETTIADSGVTPLHIACLEGNLLATKYLITKGAKINVLNKENWTPLHYAAYRGDKKTVAYLIAHGANTTATTNTNSKSTPLEFACLHNHLNAIKAFVCNGAVITPACCTLTTNEAIKKYLTTKAQFFNLNDTNFEKQIVESLKATDPKVAKKAFSDLLTRSASRHIPFVKRLYDTICKNFTPEERTAFGFNYTDIKYFYRGMAQYTESPFMKEQWIKRSKEDFSLRKNLSKMLIPGYLKSKIKNQEILSLPKVTVKTTEAKEKFVDVTVWTTGKTE